MHGLLPSPNEAIHSQHTDDRRNRLVEAPPNGLGLVRSSLWNGMTLGYGIGRFPALS